MVFRREKIRKKSPKRATNTTGIRTEICLFYFTRPYAAKRDVRMYTPRAGPGGASTRVINPLLAAVQTVFFREIVPFMTAARTTNYDRVGGWRGGRGRRTRAYYKLPRHCVYHRRVPNSTRTGQPVCRD